MRRAQRVWAHDGTYVDVLAPRWAARQRWSLPFRAVAAVVTFAAVAGGVAGVSGLATWLYAPLPAVPPELPPLVDTHASVILAADGSVLAELAPLDAHTQVAADEISDPAKLSVVAAEDARFFDHPGVDPAGIARAAVRNYQGGGVSEGGSTITQQLVKVTTDQRARTFDRKVNEATLAVRLERSTPKDEILARYLNVVYFGNGAHGIEAAARRYFAKPASELSWSEGALLAQAVPAPTRRNPLADPDGSESRRVRVLEQAVAAGFLSRADADVAIADRPVLAPAEVTVTSQPFFVDWVLARLESEVGLTVEDLRGGGYTVTTTLDPAAQASAEQAAGRLGTGEPEVAVATVDPSSGGVVALVGGRDYAASQVNLALGVEGGGSGRQMGSAFKAIVAAEAFMQGRTPDTVYPAPAVIQPDGFTSPVGNADGRDRGEQSLRDAMATSTNTVYVALTVDVGIGNVAQRAREMGIATVDPASAPGGIGLGVVETSPAELASAYATIAADGVHRPAGPLARVVAVDGEVLYDRSTIPARQALTAAAAAHLDDVLAGVIESGTGSAAAIGRPAAGKTGTTNDYTDAVFAGYTGQFATVVWVGWPEGRVPMRNVAGVAAVSGGTLPARIWQEHMARLHDGLPVLELSDGVPAPAERPSRVVVSPRQRMTLTTTTTMPRELRPPATMPTTTTTTSTTTTSTSTTTTSVPEDLPSTTTTTTTSTSVPDDPDPTSSTTTTSPATTTSTTSTSTTTSVPTAPGSTSEGPLR